MLAEFLDIDGLLVAGLLGCVGVQVEGEPGCGEGVIGVGLLVVVYGDLEAVLAHVTPGADCIADDGDVVVCHVAEGVAESQDGRLICLEGVDGKGRIIFTLEFDVGGGKWQECGF